MKIPLVACCLALVVSSSFAEDDPEFRKSPITRSEALPQQRWKLDEAEAKQWKEPFAKPLRKILEAGLPDPAKLPYRKIEIPTGNCSDGDSGITVTEGWLLPKGGTEDRFAIAWNGLVYPVVSDKGDADLAGTVAAMLVKEKDGSGWFATGETLSVSPTNATVLRCLYLERLGFHDAAVKLAVTGKSQEEEKPLNEDGMLVALAGDWMWFLYDRAVCAHMRGDPKLALASLDEEMRIYPELKKWQMSANEKERDDKPWLEEIEAFRKECKRRIAAGKTGMIDEKALSAGDPNVKALIDALDRIQIPQPGQPADVPLWESPVVVALAAKGNEAVEPLIKCLESDRRLTQSVHYWRMHHRSRTILGVEEAVIYALQRILHADFFTLASTGDSLSSRDAGYRKELAREIRANWEKYGRTSGPERSFRILLDDEAGPDAWLAAAGSLLHRQERDEESGELIPPKGPMPGEVLRGKKDPSVSDLLEKRLRQAGTGADSGDTEAAGARMDLLEILLEWDKLQGRARLVEQVQKWLANGTWSSERASWLQNLIREVASEVPEVLPLFEAMAWDLDPSDYESGFHGSGAFVSQMMAQYGNAPGLKHKPEELWMHPDSPWCLAKLPHDDLASLIHDWKELELAAKEPFRSAILAELVDRSACTAVGVTKEEPKRWFTKERNGTSSMNIPDDPKFSMKPGDEVAVRRMDVVARAYRKATGDEEKQPAVLEYYWPEKDRDEFVAKLLEELKGKEPAADKK